MKLTPIWSLALKTLQILHDLSVFERTSMCSVCVFSILVTIRVVHLMEQYAENKK